MIYISYGDKMADKLYTPLQLIKQVWEITNGQNPFDAHKWAFRKFAAQMRIPFRDFTEEEYINYLSSPLLPLSLSEKGMREIDNLVKEYENDPNLEFEIKRGLIERDRKLAQKFSYFPVFVSACLHENPDEYKRIMAQAISIGDVTAEIRDEFLFPMYLNKWTRNKQVYKPDIDFVNALMDTEIKHEDDQGNEIEEPGVFISRDAINHLPSDIIYIDLEDSKDVFGKVKGIFVAVGRDWPNGMTADIFILADSEKEEDIADGHNIYYFSHYVGGVYNQDGLLDMSLSKMGLDGVGYTGQEIDLKEGDAPVDRSRACIFAMQMLTYIASKEPDILESPLTQGTYKKPPKKYKPRNDFSEVQVWEVGVKFGAALRLAQKERNTEEGTVRKSFSSRRAPLPYYRRAHWQRYWVGKGRTTCVVKWIEPVFVRGNSGAKPDQTDVKIHKVG